MKLEVFENDVKCCQMTECILISFLDTYRQNDLNTLRVDVDFIENGEIKPPFSKIPRYMWTGKIYMKTLGVGMQILFENGRKKPPFSKISRYVWMGPYFNTHHLIHVHFQTSRFSSLHDDLQLLSLQN